MRTALSDLERTTKRYIPEDLEMYFDDINDASERIWDMLENFKEVVEALEATNESVISHQLNDVLRVLTAISVVVLPLTLIASIFGMNVHVPGRATPRASGSRSGRWSRCCSGWSGRSGAAASCRRRQVSACQGGASARGRTVSGVDTARRSLPFVREDARRGRRPPAARADRQPVRDVGLAARSQPRRRRAAQPLRGARHRHQGAADTRRSSRREAAEEGDDAVITLGGDGTVNEAANGLAGSDDAAVPAPGRLAERLREDARHPGRHRRRDAAPAADLRLLAPAPRRPGPRGRPPVHLLGRRRPRRERRRARRREPREEGPLARLRYYAVSAVARVPAPLPRPPAADPRRDARKLGPRRHGRSSRTATRTPTSASARSASARASASTTARSPPPCCERASPVDLPTMGARLLADNARGHRPQPRRARYPGSTASTSTRSAIRSSPLQVDGDFLGRFDRRALRGRARRADRRQLSAQALGVTR